MNAARKIFMGVALKFIVFYTLLGFYNSSGLFGEELNQYSAKYAHDFDQI